MCTMTPLARTIIEMPCLSGNRRLNFQSSCKETSSCINLCCFEKDGYKTCKKEQQEREKNIPIPNENFSLCSPADTCHPVDISTSQHDHGNTMPSCDQRRPSSGLVVYLQGFSCTLRREGWTSRPANPKALTPTFTYRPCKFSSLTTFDEYLIKILPTCLLHKQFHPEQRLLHLQHPTINMQVSLNRDICPWKGLSVCNVVYKRQGLEYLRYIAVHSELHNLKERRIREFQASKRDRARDVHVPLHTISQGALSHDCLPRRPQRNISPLSPAQPTWSQITTSTLTPSPKAKL